VAGGQHARAGAGECGERVEPFGVRRAGPTRFLCCCGRAEGNAVAGGSRARRIPASAALERDPNADRRRGREECAAIRGGRIENGRGVGCLRGALEWEPRTGDRGANEQEQRSQPGEVCPALRRKRQEEAQAPPRSGPVSDHVRTMDSSIAASAGQSRVHGPCPERGHRHHLVVFRIRDAHRDDGAFWRAIA
jgi:hypothetical protein